MTTHTSHSLYAALARVIANMPSHATAIDIRLRARGLPEMTVTSELLESVEPFRPVVENGRIPQVTQEFLIVPVIEGASELDSWEMIEKARIRHRVLKAMEEIDRKYDLAKFRAP